MASTVGELTHGSEIVAAIKAHSSRLTLYDRYDRYFRGQHDMQYVTPVFREKYGALFANYCDNLCPLVVGTIKARLLLDTVGSSAKDEAERAGVFFRERRLDGIQHALTRDALLFGDAYAILQSEGDTVRLYRNDPRLIVPVYSEEDPEEMVAAVKLWRGTFENKKGIRVTVYYSDKVERYWSSATDIGSMVSGKLRIKEYTEDGESSFKHGFDRVPVFHFANQAAPGEMGLSELRDAIPIQDAINKAGFDLLVNGEFTSMAQRYITGFDVQNDPQTGQPINPFKGKEIWLLGSPDAKIGQLQSGESDKLLAVLNGWRQEMATVTGVPLYHLHQDSSIPSGAALLIIEAPLRAKVMEQQTVFGNVWENIFSTALSIKPSMLDAVWRDTAPISKSEILDVALKQKAVGYSTKQVMVELGKSAEEADAIINDRDAEDEAKAERSMKGMYRAPGDNVGK